MRLAKSHPIAFKSAFSRNLAPLRPSSLNHPPCVCHRHLACCPCLFQCLAVSDERNQPVGSLTPSPAVGPGLGLWHAVPAPWVGEAGPVLWGEEHHIRRVCPCWFLDLYWCFLDAEGYGWKAVREMVLRSRYTQFGWPA